MASVKRILILAAGAALLAACSTSPVVPTGADGGNAAGGAGGRTGSGGGATTRGAGDGAGIGVFGDGGSGPGPAGQSALLDQLVVYFDFDQSDIRPEFNQMLAAHGEYLATNPQARLRLEGHADETGSREYNIGLGERRAQAVRRILLLQGAAPDQLSTVSYGEERPAVIGSDEEAYRLNRRVELVYR